MELSNAVYRHVLESELKRRGGKFTENSIARALRMSPNTASIAVRRLEVIGAVELHGMYFMVRDFWKALYYWSAARRLSRDIAYMTYDDKGAASLEKGMPDGIAYTCYTGYANLFGNDAADYSEVYVYATERSLPEVMRRFPRRRFSAASDYANLIVLRPDKVMGGEIDGDKLRRSTVPVTQLYVDLWNLRAWYAHEFETKLRARIGEMYGKKLL